jgi:hypothetical protein
MRARLRRRQQSVWTVHSIPPEPDPPSRAWNDPSWTPPDDDDDPDPVTSITLMPEYGVELPLWGADWWQLDLPPDLLDEPADWQKQFNTSHRPETGWISEAVATERAHRANDLAEALRRALPASLPVRVDLWPVAEPRRRRCFNRNGS